MHHVAQHRHADVHVTPAAVFGSDVVNGPLEAANRGKTPFA